MAAVLSSLFGAGAQLFTATGAVLAGGKIYTCLAGTTTPAATWTDSTQLTQNSNPLVLDSAGRTTTEIWIANNTNYKFVVTDSSGNPIGYTYDNIPGVNASNATLSEWVSGPTPTYISSTSFSVPGNQVAIYEPGRRVQYSVTAGTYYGTINSATYNGSTLTTVVITADSTGLDASLSGLNYGFLNATPSSVPTTGAVTSAQVQNQTVVAFTTAGTSTAYTLSPAPTVSALAAGQCFDVTFNQACGAAPTLAISGLTALPLVKRSATGGYVALAANDVVSGFVSTVVVLAGATQILVTEPLNAAFGLLGAGVVPQANYGALQAGGVAMSFADTGTLASFASSTNSYNQVMLQNTNSGATASTSLVVNNDAGTTVTNFAEFGINSSGFTGSGAFNQPGYGYLASASTDLAIGTYGSNSIHFVVNSGVTDAFGIIAAGAPKFPSLTTTQKTAIANAAGLMVFDSTLGQFSGNNGVAWTAVGGSGAVGGGADLLFSEYDQLMTTSFTLGQDALTTCTISISSPAVITMSNNFVANQPVIFTTTGALPTGLAALTTYYVLSTGLSSSSFQVSTTKGGTAVVTSGSQSGTQSCGKQKNASMAGPLVINTGATLTIPTGSRLVVL